MTAGRRVLLAVAVALIALLVPASPAAAHAALVAASPAPGSVLGSSPTEITIVFSERVAPVAGRVQVLAPDGERIGGVPTVRGAVLRIPVRAAARPLGSYLVSYRVISADGHPVGGGLTFAVGAPSARPPAVTPGGVHRSVTLAAPAVRSLGYAGLALAIGPALFLALLWPRRASRRGPTRMVYAGLGLTAAATLAQIWLQVPAATGDPAWVAAPAALAGVLGSGYGAALIARLAVLAVVAVLLPPVLRGRLGRSRGAAVPRGRPGRSRGPAVPRGRAGRVRWPANLRGPADQVRGPAVVALAVGGLATWPLTGHAVASPMPPVAATADVVHLAAMAVWLGGLVTLAVFLLRRTPPRVLGVLLPAWSRWAAIAVVWLVAGGVVQAVVHVGSVGALWQTGYGRLLLAKIGILAATLAAAGYARRLVHRRAVPVAGPGRLRVAVGIEMAATAVIMGLSGALVQANPVRGAADRPAAVDDGVSQTLTCPLYTLQFNIYPVQVGENNTIHAFAYTPAGAPLNVDQWTVSARLAGPGGLEPVSAPLLGLIPRNHAAGAVTFPQAGTYQVRFTLRIGELDQDTVTTSITVPRVPEAR